MENKICVYTICKNESKFVDKWLASMSEADYVVVLDTGSEDGTFELLKNDPRVYRAEQKVITPWRFDVARNESLKLVPDDANILVCPDLDEVFEPGWAQILRDNWIEGVHERGLYNYIWSHTESGEPALVFHHEKIHSRDWCWNFPVHESLVRKNDLLDGSYSYENTLYLTDRIHLHHYPAHKDSRSSYLPLLELRSEENPTDYFGKVYLAHEYYYSGKYQKSIDLLNHMLTEYPDQYSDFYKANFYLVMGDSYRGLGEYDKCLAAYQKAILTDKTYREPYVNMAKVLNELHYYQQAIGVVKECINTSYRHYDWLERGECWAGALYDILSISYYYVGDYENSLANIHKALYYNPKDERLLSNLKFIEEKLF